MATPAPAQAPAQAPGQAPAAAARLPPVVCNNLWQACADRALDLPHDTAPLRDDTLPLVPEQVVDEDVVFVKTDLLGPFVDGVLPRLAGRRGLTLVTGHSDLSPAPREYRAVLPALSAGVLARWLAVNLPAGWEAPGVRALPLGVAEPDRPHGDQAALAAAAWAPGAAEPPRDPRALLPAPGPSHPMREALGRALAGHPRAAVVHRRLPYAEYLAELRSHAYAICPRGNGIDVHRVYECMVTGTVALYVSDDPPPAVYARMPAVVCCTPAQLPGVLDGLPARPALSPDEWRRSLEAALTRTYVHDDFVDDFVGGVES
jgi:hypothetical protein